MNEEDERLSEPRGSPDAPPPSAQPDPAPSSPALTVDGQNLDEAIETAKNAPITSQHHSLKHHLLGPSLTKAGQNGVDQRKVAEVIYEASKGSNFFNNEEVKDKTLTVKIDRILKSKAQLEKLDLKQDLRRADAYITELELSRDLSQYVVHIDCDAFYAAVEEIDRPELKTVPMAVGQGVLTTCNYEARKYGCRSAMAGFVAKKLCPQLICLPLNFDKYTAKAKEVRAVLAEYDPRFESSSIDEAYLNVTQYCEDHQLGPEEAIMQLRNEVHERCKITISAGIAPNAKIAKICSNKNKPNGQFRVSNDRLAVMVFMRDLPVRKVNGVGRVLERELDAIGVKTCGDIYEYRAYLNRLFGEKTNHFLLQTYLGLGRTDVQPAEDHERKSVGTESTFRDMSSKAELRSKLRRTAEELEKDMKRVEVKGRTLCLKIKLHTYEVFTRQVIPPKAIFQADDLYNYSLPMLAKLEREIPNMRLRLMGLRCTHLMSTKRADVDSFFANAKRGGTSGGAKRDSEGEWEVWPDEEFEEAARRERQADLEELEHWSQEEQDRRDNGDDQNHISPFPGLDVSNRPQLQVQDFSTADWHEPFGRYKYGSAPNTPEKPQLAKQISNDETWDCPICGTAQAANDMGFNAHIDLCLSKGTIRDAVAEGAVALQGNERPPTRPSSAAGMKRKSAIAGDSDRKQKKLFFA
ncbi:hypothetical protein LTR70_004626 [Exophiala xenobiotica]|uniref:DNA polymerase kappa n=1 Tax=Lithohypha guttulata TaxID=1690604 RepID=A0ABR0KCQ2_9EURO|nr:hypothetical protein LTR24_004117 [Lithohypha guttulata]KAK5320399.1 hypothetical protein LTR70_004626 [Exophiala xenobiotica]